MPGPREKELKKKNWRESFYHQFGFEESSKLRIVYVCNQITNTEVFSIVPMLQFLDFV